MKPRVGRFLTRLNTLEHALQGWPVRFKNTQIVVYGLTFAIVALLLGNTLHWAQYMYSSHTLTTTGALCAEQSTYNTKCTNDTLDWLHTLTGYHNKRHQRADSNRRFVGPSQNDNRPALTVGHVTVQYIIHLVLCENFSLVLSWRKIIFFLHGITSALWYLTEQNATQIVLIATKKINIFLLLNVSIKDTGHYW